MDRQQLHNGQLEDGVMAFLKPHRVASTATAPELQRKAG
jgi:hypothetical protein